ncbi:hypothetical protein [Desulfopila sp. IMCC35006]|nr:hypothetical protein [Desulfopila sp. IMCC35006]
MLGGLGQKADNTLWAIDESMPAGPDIEFLPFVNTVADENK